MSRTPGGSPGIDRKWLPLNALRAFEAAGRHLSFTAAAASLSVAQSAVSRHVIVLETFLGAALFERRHQHLVLTEAGRHLLPAVSRGFDRIDHALAEIVKERDTPRRVLRIALPPTFAHRLAVPILRDFRAAHPDLSLEVASTGPETEADIAIVYSQPRVSDTIFDLLWMERLAILCSPDLLAGTPPPDAAALIAANDLLHVRVAGRSRHFLWEMMTRVAGCHDLAVERGLVFDTAELAVRYALSGAGLALVDPVLFADDIDAGRLARPFADHLDGGYGYFLTIAPEDLDDAAVALFRSWLIGRFIRPGSGA